MKINVSKIEEKILKSWKKKKIFEKSLKQRKNSPIFSFYDGPPFATGLPHYGHILASTIKDVVPRYWAMKGYYVPRRWGWDCHGLPIENMVEQELKISGKKEIEKIGVGKFNKACCQGVLLYAKEWKKMVDRIGRFVDLENAYKTMDNDYIESVWWGLKEIWKKGLIYEGRKVLLYCPRCECPISNFEVAMDNSYKDMTEESITVKFKTKNAKEIIGVNDKNLFLLAWTTTPWTLPANAALAVLKKLDYILVTPVRDSKSNKKTQSKQISNGARQNKEFYILAESRKEALTGEFKVLKKFRGKDLMGIEYEPLFQLSIINNKLSFENQYKVLAGDFVTADEGTGIVHIAPVYGEDDYKLGIEFNLPIVPLLDAKGIFNESAPEFVRGMYFKKSERPIKENLSEKNLFYKKEKTTHPYPFCWRCETTLFYSAVPAWFINIQKIKEKMIKLNKGINWHPSHLKSGRFLKGIESAPDWTISRNRYWASPLPIWKCGECENKKIIGSKKDLLKQKFSDNKYFILRHGQTAYQNNKKSELYPYPEKRPVKLNKTGEKQIKSIIGKVKKLNIDFIYASDTYRVKQTAEILAKEIGLKINFSSKLRDINLGIYSGRTKKEFYNNFPDIKERFLKTPQKGENWNSCRKRMLDFIKEIDKKHSTRPNFCGAKNCGGQGKTILIISHGDPLWLLEGAMKGLSDEEFVKQKTGKKTIKTGEFKKINFKVLPYNQTGKLDFHRPYIDEVKFQCECGEIMERIPEVIDCWVESASMPFAEIHYPFENKKYFKKRFPSHFVAEYIAQTRAWFYVMHAMSAILFNKAPFKNVVTTGTILNEKGEKLSKSKKNYPDPWGIIDKYGVDALRFYLMSSPVMRGEDLFFSEKDLKEIYRKNILLPLNILSFYETYKLPLSSSVKGEHILDKWILSRLNQLTENITEKMDNYDVVSATREINNFINDISLWYLRRSRSRFKNKDNQGIKVFGYVLLQLSKIVAPFTPFIADHIYRSVGGKKKSVHLEDFPKADKKMIDKKLISEIELIRKIVSLGLKARTEAGIKVRQPIASLKIRNPKSEIRKEILDLVKDELNVKEIEMVKAIKKEKNFVVEGERELKIALDIKITDELKEEGVLREIVRHIQVMRKKAGLKPKDKISIYCSTSGSLADILIKNKKTILKDLKTEKLESGEFPAKILLEKEVEISGNKIRLGIEKKQ